MKKATVKDNPFAIPTELAVEWVTNWINSKPQSTTSNQDVEPTPTQMRAFVVKRQDLLDLLAEGDTDYVRMYIGIENDAKTGEQNAHLLLVDAQMVTETPLYIKDMIDGEDSNGNQYTVNDFSQKCPPICDPESVLFVLPTDGSSPC